MRLRSFQRFAVPWSFWLKKMICESSRSLPKVSLEAMSMRGIKVHRTVGSQFQEPSESESQWSSPKEAHEMRTIIWAAKPTLSKPRMRSPHTTSEPSNTSIVTLWALCSVGSWEERTLSTLIGREKLWRICGSISDRELLFQESDVQIPPFETWARFHWRPDLYALEKSKLCMHVCAENNLNKH